MSVSLDTVLSSLNIDLEDLEGLTADEIETKISDALPEGMSATELEELKTDILTELSALEDEWEDLLDGEEEDYDDSETEEGKARAERNMEEIDESLDLLATFEDALDEPFEHELLLYREESGDEVSFTTEGLNDGDAVTIKATGTQATTESMWGEEDDEDLEVTDSNMNGYIDSQDYEAAQVATASESTAQMLFLGAAGETYTLAEDGADYTVFNVTDANGNTYTLRIEGKPAIYFEPGTVTLDAISGYSDDLAKRCYERGDTVSFYDHQNTDELTEEEKLAAEMESYTEVTSQEAFDTVWGTLSTYIDEDYTNALSLTQDQVQQSYNDAIDILYGYLNDTSTYADMSTAWAAVFQKWTSEGLDANAQRAIIEALVLGVSQQAGKTIFQAIFAPVATTLQEKINAIEGEDYNTLDKAIALLLDSQTGITSTLWTEAFATTDVDGNYIQGTWKDNEENKLALDLYQSLCDQTGWALTTGVADAKAAEEAVVAAEEVENDPVNQAIQSDLQNCQDFLSSNAAKLADIATWGGYTNLDAATFLELDGLFENLKTSDNYFETIKNFFNNYDGNSIDVDDLASAFVLIVGYCSEELESALLGDKEIRDWLHDRICDGGTPAFGTSGFCAAHIEVIPGMNDLFHIGDNLVDFRTTDFYFNEYGYPL